MCSPAGLPRHLVIDGAMGTEVIKVVGDNFNKDTLWSSRFIQNDEHIFMAIHRKYLESGADIIMTNTYKPTPEMFMDRLNLSLEESLELFRKAARVACQVRDEFWEEAQKNGTKRCRPLVVGSQVSYAGRTYTADEYVGAFVDKTSFEEMVRGHRDKTRALLEGGVDILGFETFPYAGEGKVVAELLKEFPAAKAWLSFSCKDGKHVCHGETFRAAVMTSLLSDQIVAVGINCSKPEFVTSLLREIPEEVKQKKIIVVYPNNGKSWHAVEKYWYWEGEERRAIHDYVTEWVEAGATWVGGCCNVSYADVTNIRDIMDNYRQH